MRSIRLLNFFGDILVRDTGHEQPKDSASQERTETRVLGGLFGLQLQLLGHDLVQACEVKNLGARAEGVRLVI